MARAHIRAHTNAKIRARVIGNKQDRNAQKVARRELKNDRPTISAD